MWVNNGSSGKVLGCSRFIRHNRSCSKYVSHCFPSFICLISALSLPLLYAKLEAPTGWGEKNNAGTQKETLHGPAGLVIWQATKMTHPEAPPVGQALAWISSKALPNKIHVQPVWTVTRPETHLCSFDFSLLLWILPCARTCAASGGR